MYGDDARHRGLADAVKARHLGPRLAPGDDTFGDFPSLGVIEFLPPSADTPLRPGGGWSSVSMDQLLSCGLGDLIGPGVNDGITVEVIEIGQDAAFEFVL